MNKHLIQQKKGKLLTLLISMVVFLLFNRGFVCAGEGPIHIQPASIKFIIREPAEGVPANHSLIVERKEKADGNIYYRATDSYVSGINLAEYVMAKTPYAGCYQVLDKPVRFLADRDRRVKIRLKFKIDDIFWETVPDGNYNLKLVSDKGKSVKIRVKVKKSPLLTISPGRVNILADSGAGLYQSRDPVNVFINSKNSRWNIDIEASPLLYHGRDNSPSVLPGDIYLSVDSNNNFNSLADVYQINGSNYGKKANLNLYFQVDVGHNLFAGYYSGELIFTISKY